MHYPLLEKIHTSSDIKTFSLKELELLAIEIRQRIIEVLSVNGGHLASNLGMVEISIALHKVFNSPSDKFIFDVSHQSYPHKLLTGRNKYFQGIRKHKGLCGFCNPKESPHDHFYAGHAGTALSLGLGTAKNRDLTKRKEHIIPIVGDASLTCGLTLEALNNISKTLGRFIIILNDNAMSISNNVGAITSILSRIINSPASNKIYRELESIASKIPLYGERIAKQGSKITESLKNLVSPAAFFEQFHLSYIGPIDGHNLKELIDLFELLKNGTNPVVVHLITKKGQGMDLAVNNPITYHGVKPFNRNTGAFLPVASTRPTFPKLFGKHILKMAENDPSVVCVTPAMSAGSCLDAFMEKFPERCIDVGIAEGHAVTYCGGIAYGGKMKVVSSIYATFLQRALDNLFHDVCLQELPVVFAVDRAGISGPDGSTHHGVYDISFLNAMPNMVICQPRNGHVLLELLESSFSFERPTAIRYPNMETDEPNGPLLKRTLGTAEILQEGEEFLIIALGHMCHTAKEVAYLLKEEGILATILDPVFVKPLDTDLLVRLLMTHKYVITIEEHSLACGLGSIINNFLVSSNFNNIQVLNFGIPETFVSHGGYTDLIKELGLTANQISERILHSFSSKKPLVKGRIAP
ncbi:MAG: 1-deoxy-D-xylulose-5-phosphate synthase [Chlamydiales bacterium]|nr:1-deoxy-D-xylulose-5-phosphate synthase [Chlamydiales bacterium]